MAIFARCPHLGVAGLHRRRVLLLVALCLASANGCLSADSDEQGLVDGGSTNAELSPDSGSNPGTSAQVPSNANGATVVSSTTPTAGNANLTVPANLTPTKLPTKALVASLFDGSSCLDVHRIDATYDVNLYRCTKGNGGQLWNVLANGQVQWAENPNLCLSLSTSATASTIPLTLAPCSSDATQTWSVDGPTVRHVVSGRCLAFKGQGIVEPDGIGMYGVSLETCDASRLYQRWGVGAYESIAPLYGVQQANATMQAKCSPEVFLWPYSSSDAGAKRVVGRYGSDAKFLTFVRQALVKNCNAMFLTAADAPPRRSVGIVFDTVCTGGAVVDDFSKFNPVVRICSKFFATVDETEMPFSLRVDAMLHHELAHTFDVYGKPSSFLEGYANLVVYRTGYLYNNKRAKGGNWNDGYSTTTFFLLWLDSDFSRKPIGERFSDVMQRRSYEHFAAQDDPNWFFPWVKQETGFTVDQLWSKYQTSF